MKLKKVTSSFNKTVKIVKGENIFREWVQPLCRVSSKYLRMSSFFSINIMKDLFYDIKECLKSDGEVKIVIGCHDADDFIPILNKLDKNYSSEILKKAIELILTNNITECIKNIHQNQEDFLDVFTAFVETKRIKIKIGLPRDVYNHYLETGQFTKGIFHPKISIFEDESDTVVLDGSVNDSFNGYGSNIEQANLHYEWLEGGNSKVKEYKKIANNIWNDKDDATKTLEFNKELKKIIKDIQTTEEFKKYKKSIEARRIQIKHFNYNTLNKLIENSPFFYSYSFKNVRLLPHQKTIYRTIHSRWPIQGILADEVGLGKTIEAGSSIKYLTKFTNIQNVCLLVPAGLKTQWQLEMKKLFNLDFYIFENKKLIKPNGEKIENVTIKNCFSKHNQIIISWHYIRKQKVSDWNKKVDFIIVDEAHNARKKITNNQEEKTQLFSCLEEGLKNVQHKLLLTATPLQTSFIDYTSLIQLFYPNHTISPKFVEKIIKLNKGEELEKQEQIRAIEELIDLDIIPDIKNTKYLNTYNDDFYIQNHPTSFLTLRNTRDTLQKIGYKFPTTNLQSEAITIDGTHEKIFNLIYEYLEHFLFLLEKSIKDIFKGFISSLYKQRIASSIQAAFDTLKGRKQKLETYKTQGFIELQYDRLKNDDVIDNLDWTGRSDIGDDVLVKVELKKKHIVKIDDELEMINEVLSGITKMQINKIIQDDPKVKRVIDLIDKHTQKNHKLIIFSRYTSTTKSLSDHITVMKKYNFGVFEGDRKLIIKKNKVIESDKNTLVKELKESRIQFIICSDAASEGLNLQAANILINVDVPWNPARLLQRFGRIDRFGQTKNIMFYNCYYKDTIEDRMYTQLLKRNKDFRSILGHTPEITDSIHINDLADQQEETTVFKNDTTYRNSILKMSRKDNERIHETIFEIIKKNKDIQINKTKGKIKLHGEIFPYSLDFMEKDYLDLNHPLFSKINTKISNSKHILSLYGLKNKQKNIFIYCVEQNDDLLPITEIKEMLNYIIIGTPINLKNKKRYKKDTLNEMLLDIRADKKLKFINHEDTPYDKSKISLYEGLNIGKEICKIYCD